MSPYGITRPQWVNSNLLMWKLEYSRRNGSPYWLLMPCPFLSPNYQQFIWIPRTKGQLRGKCFHLMMSSWWKNQHWVFFDPGDFPTQRPVTRSFDVFFDLRLNKRLSKQPWGWWFETPSWSLWRQCNDDFEIYHSYALISLPGERYFNT